MAPPKPFTSSARSAERSPSPSAQSSSAQSRIPALADFRYTLRQFLHFSEEAATAAGIAPQQHQLLLQIAGAPRGTVVSVGYLAGRLALRHHSVVELCDRSEQAGLILRKSDPVNRRTVVLQLTAEGSRILSRLSADHARELNEFAPALANALESLARLNRPSRCDSAQASGATP